MSHDRAFQGNRTNPFSARLNNILTPILNFNATVGVNCDDVASAKPTVSSELSFLINGIVIGACNPGATHFKFSHRFPIPWNNAIAVPPPYFYHTYRFTLFRPISVLFLKWQQRFA